MVPCLLAFFLVFLVFLALDADGPLGSAANALGLTRRALAIGEEAGLVKSPNGPPGRAFPPPLPVLGGPLVAPATLSDTVAVFEAAPLLSVALKPKLSGPEYPLAGV